jgi:hypothetical protein
LLGLALGCFGLLYGGARLALFLWLTTGVAAAYPIFAITYNTADSYAYLILAYVIFAIWIGLGMAIRLRFITRQWLRAILAHMPCVSPTSVVVAVLRGKTTTNENRNRSHSM